MPVVISVAGQKGGSMKSALARAIAVVLAENGQSTVILDLDTKQATSFEWAETRKMNLITPAIEVVLDKDGPKRIDDLMKETAIVIDCPGWSDRQTFNIAKRSDVMVLPTAPTDDDARPLAVLHADLVARGIDPARLVVVITGVLSDAEFKAAAQRLSAEAGIEVCPFPLRSQIAYRKALSGGYSITEVAQDKLRDEANQIVSYVLSRIPNAMGVTRNDTEIDLSWL